MSFGGGSGSFSSGNVGNTGGGNDPPKPAFSFGGAPTQQISASSSPAGGFSFASGSGQTLGGNNSQQPSTGSVTFSFNGSGGSGNLFGGAGAAPPAIGSATPTSKPAFSFGTPAASNSSAAPTTTPASAPPTNLFSGFNKPAPAAGGGSSLFGQPSTSKPVENSAPASSLFSGFGSAQNNAAGAKPASTGGFTLGAAPNNGAAAAPAGDAKPSGFSFNAAPAPASNTGFSFGPSKPAESTSTPAAPASSTSATTKAAPFSFGTSNTTTSAPPASSSTTATSQPTTAPTSLFSGFKTDDKDKAATLGTDAAKPPTTFAGFGGSASTPTNTASTTGTSNLFAAKPPAAAAPAATTPVSSSTAPAPAPAGGLFAGFGKPASSTESKTPAAPPAAATGSTPAVAPMAAPSIPLPAPSMLRGRNMEEIVNKWSQELENATKEFTRQASEVAVWDGVLRRGGDEISRLIQALQAAEERQSSIEQTLDYVEQQQADLTSLLDGYESQVAELLQGATTSGINAYGSQGVTRSMETGAADAERERAYAMAESLNAQLDELSRNLSSMIVEVNNLSSSTAAARPQAEPDANALGPLRLGNKLHNSGADPVSQIVAILNAHLGSLKWIDESTNALREKVENLRRGQVGGEARSNRDRVTASPSTHRQEGVNNTSTSRNRQSSVGPGNDTFRASSVGPGYSRGASVGRNAGSGWSEATIASGGSNLGRSRGYGL